MSKYFWAIQSKKTVLPFTVRTTKKQCIADQVYNRRSEMLWSNEKVIKVRIVLQGSTEDKILNELDRLNPITRRRIEQGIKSFIEIPGRVVSEVYTPKYIPKNDRGL